MDRKEKRPANSKNAGNALWIAPRYRMKPTAQPTEWDVRPNPNRLIELADTALKLWEFGPSKSKGLKKG
jgi:hypothetical protein